MSRVMHVLSHVHNIVHVHVHMHVPKLIIIVLVATPSHGDYYAAARQLIQA